MGVDVFAVYSLFFVLGLIFVFFETAFSFSSLLVSAVAIWLLASLAWVPFAGIIYQRTQSATALAGREAMQRPWLTGAVASALFFLPWVYLLLRTKGRAPSTKMLSNGYRLLYALWILGPLTYFLLVVGTGTADARERFVFPILVPDQGEMYQLIPLVAGLSTLISLVFSCDGYRREIAPSLESAKEAGIDVDLCSPKHVQPLAIAYLWMVSALVVRTILPPL